MTAMISRIIRPTVRFNLSYPQYHLTAAKQSPQQVGGHFKRITGIEAEGKQIIHIQSTKARKL
jgi:hypothetical protein